MIRANDIVVRISHPIEGSLQKGSRAIVKSIIDDKYMTLEGHSGNFLIEGFRLDSMGSSGNPQRNPTVSDLESVEEALRVIDVWNRSHPTAAMISITAYPAQDGGSTYSTACDDFNDVESMVAHLGCLASQEERKSTLRKAMGLLQVELGD